MLVSNKGGFAPIASGDLVIEKSSTGNWDFNGEKNRLASAIPLGTRKTRLCQPPLKGCHSISGNLNQPPRAA
jgi:hypothetical protein